MTAIRRKKCSKFEIGAQGILQGSGLLLFDYRFILYATQLVLYMVLGIKSDYFILDNFAYSNIFTT